MNAKQRREAERTEKAAEEQRKREQQEAESKRRATHWSGRVTQLVPFFNDEFESYKTRRAAEAAGDSIGAAMMSETRNLKQDLSYLAQSLRSLIKSSTELLERMEHPDSARALIGSTSDHTWHSDRIPSAMRDVQRHSVSVASHKAAILALLQLDGDQAEERAQAALAFAEQVTK